MKGFADETDRFNLEKSRWRACIADFITTQNSPEGRVAYEYIPLRIVREVRQPNVDRPKLDRTAVFPEEDDSAQQMVSFAHEVDFFNVDVLSVELL